MKPFVPQLAREYFKEILCGIPGQESGALEEIEELKSQLEGIRENLDFSDLIATRPPQETRNPYLVTGQDADWDRVIRESIAVRERIVKNVEILSDHDQMRDGYDRLRKELTTRQQWRDFFYSALEADSAHSRYRAAVKRGMELTSKIEETATKLADLLSEFNLLDFDNFPLELLSIWHLLNITDDSVWRVDDPEKRFKYKGLILGEDGLTPDPLDMPSSYSANPLALRELMKEDVIRAVRVSQRNGGPVDDSPLDLQTAWRAAPKITALLRCLAGSAGNYRPEQEGMIGAAIASREKPWHIQYVKGFGYLLIERGIPLTANIKKAMHIITNLIMQDENPDFEMAYRTVNDALKDFPKA
jgi:hypothetical protein